MADTKISALVETTLPAAGDYIPIADTSLGQTRKVAWARVLENNMINVLSYSGVDRTGSTDSTIGIQNAINDALAIGGGVFLPVGKYLVGKLYTYYDATLNPGAPNNTNNDNHIRIIGEKNLGFTAALAGDLTVGACLSYTGSTGNCLSCNDGGLSINGSLCLEEFAVVGNTRGRLISIERPGGNVNLTRVTCSNRRTAETTAEKTVTSITRTGNTATASSTSHGFVTGDSIFIEGANEDSFNGCHEVTSASTNSFTFRITDTTSSSASTNSVMKAKHSNGICLFLRDAFLIRARDLQCYGHNSYEIGFGIVQEAHHSHGAGLGTFDQCTSTYFNTAAQFGKQWASSAHHTHAFKMDSCQFSRSKHGLILRHGCTNYWLVNNYWEVNTVAGLWIKDACEKVIIEGGDNSCNLPTMGQLVTGVGGHVGISFIASNGTNTRVTTVSNHNLASGDKVDILGYNPRGYTNLNGSYSTITVIDADTFEIAVNISGDGGVGSGGMVIGWDLSADPVDPRKANATGDIIINNYFSRWVGSTADAIRRWVGRDGGMLKIENSYFIGDSVGAGEGIVCEDNVDPRLYCKDIHWIPTGFGQEISDASKFVAINNSSGAHADGVHLLTEAKRVNHAMPYLGTAKDWTDWKDVPNLFKSNGSLTHYLPVNPTDGARFTVYNADGNTVTIHGNGKNIATISGSASSFAFSQIRAAYTFEYDGAQWRCIGSNSMV